jgi:hypothetical protein
VPRKADDHGGPFSPRLFGDPVVTLGGNLLEQHHRTQPGDGIVIERHRTVSEPTVDRSIRRCQIPFRAGDDAGANAVVGFAPAGGGDDEIFEFVAETAALRRERQDEGELPPGLPATGFGVGEKRADPLRRVGLYGGREIVVERTPLCLQLPCVLGRLRIQTYRLEPLSISGAHQRRALHRGGERFDVIHLLVI